MKAIETFELPPPSRVNYINAQYGLKSWLLTKDHKRIALLYLGSITFFFYRWTLRNDDSPGVVNSARRSASINDLQKYLRSTAY
jgi:hypothetical protein